jgi:hypothetical protein
MDDKAMNDDGVVGELRAIKRENRTKYESPYAKGFVAKHGIRTKKRVFHNEQHSNFGGDSAINKVSSYKSKRRKNRFHVR